MTEKSESIPDIKPETYRHVESVVKQIIDVHKARTYDEDQDMDTSVKAYFDWMLTKIKLNYGTVVNSVLSPPKTPSFPIMISGIYWAYLGENIGSEQNKFRPVVILRADKKNDICIAVPLTTQHLNDGNWNHIDLESYTNTALVEQVQRLSKKRISHPLRNKGGFAKAKVADMDRIYKRIIAYIGTMPSFLKDEN